ncbi:transcript variant X3 [Nothobranchius furzeri]|uniref:Transcript variant X3 n=1 Tax=Nothobranchius furzeri TaxID=105023 RepID=A0A9D2Z0F1_NOTFU|nr:transcript variant X3 [Nothobranchius furzeri]
MQSWTSRRVMPVLQPPTPCSALPCVKTVLWCSKGVPARSLRCPPPRPESMVTPRFTWSASTSSPVRSMKTSVPPLITWMSPTSKEWITRKSSLRVPDVSCVIPPQSLTWRSGIGPTRTACLGHNYL